jgi:hypothetical protein
MYGIISRWQHYAPEITGNLWRFARNSHNFPSASFNGPIWLPGVQSHFNAFSARWNLVNPARLSHDTRQDVVAVFHCELHDETALFVVTLWTPSSLHHSVQAVPADWCCGRKRDEDGIALHETAQGSRATLQV